MDTKQQLDTILNNYLKSSELFSEVIREEIENYEYGDLSLAQLVAAGERHLNALGKIIDLAPFFQTKLQIEGLELSREWLIEQHEFIGEERNIIIKFIDAYQQELLENSGHVTLTGQGALL
jgi:hypothetical protein